MLPPLHVVCLYYGRQIGFNLFQTCRKCIYIYIYLSENGLLEIDFVCLTSDKELTTNDSLKPLQTFTCIFLQKNVICEVHRIQHIRITEMKVVNESDVKPGLIIHSIYDVRKANCLQRKTPKLHNEYPGGTTPNSIQHLSLL